MRLIIVILTTCLLQVSAAGFGQKVTIVRNNIGFTELFKEIRKQTGYNVLWQPDKVNMSKTINLKVENQDLKSVLDLALKGQNLSYSIEDKTVRIKYVERSFLDKLAEAIHSLVKDIHVRGGVTDEYNKPLKGATVKIKGTSRSTITDGDGKFYFENVKEKAVLVISYLGYKTMEVEASERLDGIKLVESSSDLGEVQVVNTGYQNIPKERATGSFTQIGNALLNRSVSTNILDRLRGVTSGLSFNDNDNQQFGQSSVEVRGRATLFSNPNPLIIIDNFPYDGDLRNINPNDIESITILKDAAAASAWGARSGNGVIVITTKKGVINSKPVVSFNANLNLGQKPNLHYLAQLSSAEYIDVEQFLFKQGAYDNSIDNGYTALSPAVEIFLASRNGLPSADSLSRINKLKSFDIRDQLLKYYYRPITNQQYQASVSGGSANQKYFVSLGYDKNLNGVINNNYDRATVNVSNTYYFMKDKLELFSNVVYTGSRSNIGQSISNLVSIYPYAQIADADGTSLGVANSIIGLRPSYISTAGNGKLLDWNYRPLDELNNNYSALKNTLTDYRINLALNYKIIKGLKASALYSYEKGVNENNTLNELQSYYTRNRINTYTQINEVTSAITYPIPLGAISYNDLTNIKSQNGRFQVNYENYFGKNTINANIGTEIKDYASFQSSNILYGYNPETASNQNSAINYTADNPFFYGYNTGRIITGMQQLGNANRFLSYYFNGSYAYNNKYIVSISARRDESNLFGVATNQKGVPLWSTGLAWLINKENFYGLSWLPELKIRATYGYTGNVNNSISAYLTAVQAPSNIPGRYNAPYANITNPPNSSLRWEKYKNINFGVDFSTLGSRVNGSIDIWKKIGMDLIGNSPIAPQTGVSLYTGNSASTVTNGVDLQFNSVNLDGEIKWLTTLLYNYNSSKVTNYKVSNGNNLNVVSSNFTNPLEGYPYYSVFSFRYGGLDKNGNPQGYLNNIKTKDYTGIINSINRNELVYNGPATPTSFGYFRNTITYKNVELSFNISYKFGYYFRRESLNNSSLYGGAYQMPDYSNRWQKAGDELNTNTPSLIYPADQNRDAIYTYSDFLVQKGDNIRLQDIRLGYTLGKKSKLPFKNMSLYTYINNVGILWRANNYHIDSDYLTSYPAGRTIAFGVKADL